jgi:hypothetical protein
MAERHLPPNPRRVIGITGELIAGGRSKQTVLLRRPRWAAKGTGRAIPLPFGSAGSFRPEGTYPDEHAPLRPPGRAAHRWQHPGPARPSDPRGNVGHCSPAASRQHGRRHARRDGRRLGPAGPYRDGDPSAVRAHPVAPSRGLVRGRPNGGFAAARGRAPGEPGRGAVQGRAAASRHPRRTPAHLRAAPRHQEGVQAVVGAGPRLPLAPRISGVRSTPPTTTRAPATTRSPCSGAWWSSATRPD